jgi:hypothetical protein
MNTRAHPVSGVPRRLPLGLGALALMMVFALPVSGHAADSAAAPIAPDDFTLLRARTVETLGIGDEVAPVPVAVPLPGAVDGPAIAWTPDLADAGRRALESAVVLPASEEDALLAAPAGAPDEASPVSLSRAPADAAPTGASL